MKTPLLEKRIPTLIGILLVVIAVFATTFLTQYGRSLLSRAGPSETPKNVKISNVSDVAFTVTWETEGPVVGGIKIGENDANSKTFLDDRNALTNGASSFKVHVSTATSLSPKTKYVFSIISGQNIYDNGGSPFSVITADKLSSENRKDDQVAGTVVFPDGKQAAGGIVLLNITNGQLLSTVVKDSGDYVFPLNKLRSIDLSAYYTPTEQENMELTVFGIDGTMAKARTSFANRARVPSITLGNDYDFTTTAFATPTPLAALSSSFTAPTPQQAKDPTLLSPKKNEVFTDQKPVFKGSAAGGATVKITIQSDPINDTVVAGPDGSWTYQPKTPLPPGTHTITVQAPDQNGIIRILTQTFIIQPLGSQVAEAATVSATPVVTLSPTPLAVAPTIIATPIVGPLLSATPVPPVAPLPKSGMEGPVIFFGGAGTLLFLLGFGLLLFKK